MIKTTQALFGDVHTHSTAVLPQAESYVNRFGPGLVIYWFGHAPGLTERDDIIVKGWDIPNQFMLPTGDIRTSGDDDKRMCDSQVEGLS